jgi:hypothetical protein
MVGEIEHVKWLVNIRVDTDDVGDAVFSVLPSTRPAPTHSACS